LDLILKYPSVKIPISYSYIVLMRIQTQSGTLIVL